MATLSDVFSAAIIWVKDCIGTAWSLTEDQIYDNVYPEEQLPGTAYIEPGVIAIEGETPVTDSVLMEFRVAHAANIDSMLGRTIQKVTLLSLLRTEITSDEHPGTSDVLYAPMMIEADPTDVSDDNTIRVTARITVMASVER